MDTQPRKIGRPRQSHCQKGHPLTEENILMMGGKRHCKTCRYAWTAAHRAKLRAENPPQKRIYTRKEKPKRERTRNTSYDLTPAELVYFATKFQELDPDDCWPWEGLINKDGYGLFQVRRNKKKRLLFAHRISWERSNGPMPPELVTDHKCRNRPCVNPHHLEAVTNRENLARGDSWKHPMPQPQSIKTHCPYGHPYDDENTIIHITPKGYRHRRCRTCLRGDYERRRSGIKSGRRENHQNAVRGPG